MLHLLVRLGYDAYAIETPHVHRVLPFARLKSLPSDQPAITGVLNFHGAAVPVIDLTLLITGEPSREHLGTRIILTQLTADGTPPRPLGLLAEGVESVTRLDPTEFQPAGVRPDGRPWLGPVIERDQRFIQRIDPLALLPAELLDALLAESAAALAA